jgi:hypothetical protein
MLNWRKALMRSATAFEGSTLPIDQEHRRTMAAVLVGRGQATVELLYELRR